MDNLEFTVDVIVTVVREVGREDIVFGRIGIVLEVVESALLLVAHFFLIFKVVNPIMNAFNIEFVLFLLLPDHKQLILHHLRHLWSLLHQNLKLILINLLAAHVLLRSSLLRLRTGLLLQLVPFAIAHGSQGVLEHFGASELMIVVAALGFKDVLVASERITVVDVAQLFDQLVHLVIVDVFEIVDLLSLLLDGAVKLSADRQIKRIIDFKSRRKNAFSGGACLSDLLVPEGLVVTNLLDFVLHIMELDVAVHPSLEDPLLLGSFQNTSSPQPFCIVYVIALDLLLLGSFF